MNKSATLLGLAAVAGILRAAMVYDHACLGGTSPLHSTWWNGALVGTAVAMAAVVAVRLNHRIPLKQKA